MTGTEPVMPSQPFFIPMLNASLRGLRATILLLLASSALALPGAAQQAFPTTNGGLLRSITDDSVRAHGSMLLRVDRTAMTMEYRFTVAELVKPVTGVWLGRAILDSNELLRPIPGAGTGPTFGGTLTELTSAEIAMIDSGTARIILTSAEDPAGFVVGRVEVVPSAIALEFDPIVDGSNGRGGAWLVVDEVNRSARYMVSWSRLTGRATEAAFVSGLVGEVGAILHEVTIPTSDSVVLGTWTGLDDNDLALLRSGRVLVGVKTDSFPSGEIAGPIVPLEFFSAAIEPANEVPPVAGSTLRGTGYGFLITYPGFPTQISFNSTVAGAEVLSAHAHRGSISEEGTVFRTLRERNEGEWGIEEDTTTSVTDLSLLRSGGMYLNYHTAAYTEGEARGQLVPALTNLSGVTMSSVRPEPEAAMGLAASVDRASGALRCSIERAVAGAHIDLYDAAGSLVASAAIDGRDVVIDGAGLTSGVHVAQLVSGSRAIARCVVVR
jgi:hypothetical protein